MKHQVIIQLRQGQPFESPLFELEEAETELAKVKRAHAQGLFAEVTWASVKGTDILSVHVAPVTPAMVQGGKSRPRVRQVV